MLTRLQLYIQEGLLEDTKGVIRIRIEKVEHNDQAKKDKRANNDLQSTTQKTKDGATRIH
jgi:hypothetical protein